MPYKIKSLEISEKENKDLKNPYKKPSSYIIPFVFAILIIIFFSLSILTLSQKIMFSILSVIFAIALFFYRIKIMCCSIIDNISKTYMTDTDKILLTGTMLRKHSIVYDKKKKFYSSYNSKYILKDGRIDIDLPEAIVIKKEEFPKMSIFQYYTEIVTYLLVVVFFTAEMLFEFGTLMIMEMPPEVKEVTSLLVSIFSFILISCYIFGFFLVKNLKLKRIATSTGRIKNKEIKKIILIHQYKQYYIVAIKKELKQNEKHQKISCSKISKKNN